MSFFDKNLELLSKRDPGLADEISETSPPDSFCILKSSSGAPTLFWNFPPSARKYLHSPVDPEREAKLLLQDRTFRKQDGTLLMGLGLGYLAKEILRKKEPQHLLCIAEAIPGLFRLAMEHRDLRDLIEDKETHFFIGDSIMKILDGFRPLNLKAISGEFTKITLPGFVEIYDGFYEKIEQRLHGHLNSLRHSFQTFLETRETSLTSLLRNIPQIVSSQAADRLAGLIKDRPAIIIAAGPSLSDDMEMLKEHGPGCFRISVDAALKPLLKSGIMPDLAVTCDSQPFGGKKTEGLSKDVLSSIPLLFTASAFSPVVEPFGGLRFVSDTENSLSRWLLSRGRRVRCLPHFGTVSHLAFIVARMMGADPILFVGLDLAFPGGKAHADGCTSPWGVGAEIRDFPSVPSNNGSLVRTSNSFITMINRFEHDIQETKARCINVSRDGAMIQGAQWMDLCRAVPSGIDRTFDYKPLLENAYRTALNNPKGDLCSSLRWLLSEASGLENDLESFRACLKRKALLEILTDYFPQYLLSFHTIPKNGFPEPDGYQSPEHEKQAALFMEEARHLLPLLRVGCLDAIHALEGRNGS